MTKPGSLASTGPRVGRTESSERLRARRPEFIKCVDRPLTVKPAGRLHGRNRRWSEARLDPHSKLMFNTESFV